MNVFRHKSMSVSLHQPWKSNFAHEWRCDYEKWIKIFKDLDEKQNDNNSDKKF